MEDEDLLIDNILDHHKAKPKVDGKAKGDRTELGLCKLLTKHFGSEFSRALGSGNRIHQVRNLPEHAKKTLSGDICVPEGFLWVIESKGGYESDINLTNVMDGNGIAQLDKFIEQVSHDAEYTGRKPIILWKRNRKPWLAVVRQADLGSFEYSFEYVIRYREWRVVNFEGLLEATKDLRSYWFVEKEST